MSILSLILALVLEQFRPVSNRNRLYLAFIRFANRLERNMNAGEYGNGALAWCIAVLPLVIVSVVAYWLLRGTNVFLGIGFSVLVLWLTMGFRQFSYAFTGISKALQADDLPAARELLSDWTGLPGSELTENEVASLTIEQGISDAYRFVFATIFWFVVLAWLIGPAGALIYRAANLLQQKWDRPGNESFGGFARNVLALMDYVPVRLAAVGFAIMGDFEDAVYCWRTQAQQWLNYDNGILLASAAGALSVRIGNAVHQDHTVKYRPELGVGDAANPDFLASAVGLVWRAVLLWVAVIMLLTVAQWLGS